MISAIGSKAYASQQTAWTGNVNLFLGAKALDEDDWEPVDEQDEWGIEVDFKQKSWPVSIAIDFLYGSDDGTLWGTEFESETSELNLGVRKIWDQFPHVRPFIGGGISFIRGEFSAPGVSDDDSAVGIWFGGGVYWTLVEHFNIGLEAKYSTAEVTLFGVDADAGGGHFGLLVGYHW
jgi:opacity protein-like surface antigen